MGVIGQLLFPVACPLGNVVCAPCILGWVAPASVWPLWRRKRISCSWLGSNDSYPVVRKIFTWLFFSC